jgi:hypothetical protein
MSCLLVGGVKEDRKIDDPEMSIAAIFVPCQTGIAPGNLTSRVDRLRPGQGDD